MYYIFPSSIAHSVSPNMGKSARISVSADTLFTLKQYIQDEPLLPPPIEWKAFDL